MYSYSLVLGDQLYTLEQIKGVVMWVPSLICSIEPPSVDFDCNSGDSLPWLCVAGWRSVPYTVILIVAVWLGIQINSPNQMLLLCILFLDNTL